MTTLVRQPVHVDDSLAALDADIAMRARRALNYNPLYAHLERSKDGQTLRVGLRDLGIQPFSFRSVEIYKRRRMRTRTWWASLLGGIAMVIVGLAFISMAAPRLPWGPLGFFSALGGCVFTMLAFVPWCFTGGWGRWRRESLNSTSSEIPAFALQTALQIHERVAAATFEVDRYYSTRQVADPDPFLVVKLGDFSAYIEVWDEPGFEQRRTR